MDLTYLRPSGSRFPTRRLILPVLPAEPKRLYIAMETYGELAKSYESSPRAVAMLEEFTYVDIGKGVPD